MFWDYFALHELARYPADTAHHECKSYVSDLTVRIIVLTAKTENIIVHIANNTVNVRQWIQLSFMQIVDILDSPLDIGGPLIACIFWRKTICITRGRAHYFGSL